MELFEDFKKSFPDVRSTTGTSEIGNTVTASNLQEPTLNHPRSHTLSPPMHWSVDNSLTRGGSVSGSVKYEDLDPTPRPAAEPFRFTPSLLDPNSSAFAAFANQPPGYYTPTPRGTNTGFTNHVNDLTTPNMGLTIGTPLSTEITMAAASDPVFAPQTIQPHQFHAYLQFTQPLQPQYVEPAFDRHETSPGSPMDLGGEIEVQQILPMYNKQYEHEHAPLSIEK